MKLCSLFAFAALLLCVNAGVTKDLCTDVTSVTSLVLSQNDYVLSVIWNVPAGSSGCELSYQITLTSNANSNIVTETTSATSFVFDGKLIPCSTVEVTVTSIGVEVGESVTASLTVATKQQIAPVLTQMTTSCNSIEMIWTGQPYEETMCEVTHFQMWCVSTTHTFTLAQNINDRFDRTFDILITVLQPDTYYTCNGYIFVTLAGFSPASENIEFESNLSSVNDLSVQEVDGVMSASWTPPLNSEDCGVVYEVIFENELGTETFETSELSYSFEHELVPCTTNLVTVTPISYTTSRGAPTSDSLSPEIIFGRINDITVNVQDTSLEVTWEKLQVGLCEIDYAIEHYIDDESQGLETTSLTSFVLSKIPCTENRITVTAVYNSNSESGSSNTLEFSLTADDIDNLGEVRNLRLGSGTIQWDAPLNAGKCPVTYDVRHEGPQGEQNYHGIEETTIEAEMTPCSLQTVDVKPYVNNKTGPLTSITKATGSSEHTPPLHIHTTPDYTGAQILVQGQTFAENECPIERAIVECTYDDVDVTIQLDVIDDVEGRVFLLVVDKLERDTLYTCRIKWDSSSFGASISFRTAPVDTKELTIDPITDSEFTILWNEKYAAGTDLVAVYTLIVKSTGPNHYIPERCDVERGATYVYEVEGDRDSFIFNEAYPNYHYNVRLITSYTFGDYNSYEKSIDSSTSVPGSPDDLNVEWIYEAGEVYNVNGSIAWSTPCDTNGDLRSFGVSVFSIFEIGDLVYEIEEASSIEPNDPISDEAYSLVFTKVNPMFTYVVSVKTVAAFEGEDKGVYITPPPACNCLNDLLTKYMHIS